MVQLMRYFFWFAFVLFLLASCGRAYFPIELKTISRGDREKGQQKSNVELVSLTEIAIKRANRARYQRKVIQAGDLSKPAKLIAAEDALVERIPLAADPGPYTLGVGDELTILQETIALTEARSNIEYLVDRRVTVSDQGYINISSVGRIKALGFSQYELEDIIQTKLLEKGKNSNFELTISGFKSKKIFVSGEGLMPITIPYTNSPIFLEEVLSQAKLKDRPGLDSRISIYRGDTEYVISSKKLGKGVRSGIRLFPDDKIFISSLNYRDEAVLVVGETGAQQSVKINAIQRPTLSDTIFSGNILSNVTSDFSQIYVIRKLKKKFVAYHLDITNPARILLANKFEMRPDDIIFVAAQPLSLYSRALSQILGSTGLTLQARDTVRSEVSN